MNCYQNRWCGWCCTLQPSLCCQCNLCPDCCRCPPPPFPYICSPPPLPPLPCLEQGPPPTRIVHEQVLVPFPVYQQVPTIPCQSSSDSNSSCDYCYEDLEPAGYSVRYSCRHRCRQACRQDACPCYPQCNRLQAPAWPTCRNKRIYKAGRPIVPGYTGHVPGLNLHGAGRSYGSATRDTCCILSKYKEAEMHCNALPDLPCRIFEQ